MNIAQWVQSVLREIFSFKNGEGGSSIHVKDIPCPKLPLFQAPKSHFKGICIPKKKSKPKTRKKLKKAA